MSNILFIGGPQDALPSIARAKSLGYGCYVVDGNPQAPALRWAWKYGLDGGVADVFESEAILDEINRNNWQRLAGVMAIATDCSPTVSIVAHTLNLPHIPLEITRLSQDKVILKETLRAGGIPVPGWADFVTKPVDGRGSRGVSIVSASNIAQDAYREAYLASRSGQVMFEQYIPGPGVSVEAVIWDSQVIFCGLTDRLYTHSLTVEAGGYGPSRFEGTPEGDACHRLVQRAVEVLGVKAGSVKFDIILDENNNYRPVILEAAIGRVGGGNNPLYLSISYNIDLVALLCSVYTGQDPTPHLAPFRHVWGASGRHVAGRYRMNGNLTKNADRGRFKMGLGRSREEAERKVGG